MTHVIAIIGAGNMGSSLIAGLINSGYPADKIWATDPSTEKLAQLQTAFHIHTTSDNQHAVDSAEIIIFAIKPQLFSTVAKPLAETIRIRHPLIISIAAGVRIAYLEKCFSAQSAIVRTMPNTPALVGCGATALFANPLVTPDQRNLAESIMRSVGITVWLTHEEEMDTVTALSGSGPAYFFLMMEALHEAAQELGLPHETARLLTLQTALGAARMAIESNSELADLRHRVTSPGGTTEKAISVLDNEIRHLFRKALQAAKQRSIELGNQELS